MKATGLMLRCFLDREMILSKWKNYIFVKWRTDENNTSVCINERCFYGDGEGDVFGMKVGDTISISIPSGDWSGKITEIQKTRNSIVEFWVKEVEWKGAFWGLDTGDSGFCQWEVANWYAPNPIVETSLYPEPIPYNLYVLARMVASYSKEPQKVIGKIISTVLNPDEV